MWYVSGNRDESEIDRADRLHHRPRASRASISSFGSGIHRCVGDRLAEQQIRILWEEILQPDLRFEIMGPPQRLYSNFIRGIRSLPIRLPGSRMKNDPVDVLIIGAGASGAAVAWSLAETKMHILCLEQGGWMNPAAYPSTGRDWEARFFGDFSPSPNIRARPEDYPINDDNSPIKIVNFNGVGGGTVMYTAHFPRLHPSDFRVRSLDGVADDWPIDYDVLVPFFEENDRMMGVSGLAGDPGFRRATRRCRRCRSAAPALCWARR